MNKELKDKQEQQRCFHRKEGDTRERMIMKRGIKMEHTFKVKRSGNMGIMGNGVDSMTFL